jgi:hypothetical protein
MFQFSGFAPRITTGTRSSSWWVAPFGNQRIYRIFAPPRCLSQLVTSFIASESQGIHHALLFTFLSNQILLTFMLFQYVKELYELAVLSMSPVRRTDSFELCPSQNFLYKVGRQKTEDRSNALRTPDFGLQTYLMKYLPGGYC